MTVFKCIKVHICKSTQLYTFVKVHICTCVKVYICTCVKVHICTCIKVHMCTCTCIPKVYNLVRKDFNHIYIWPCNLISRYFTNDMVIKQFLVNNNNNGYRSDFLQIKNANHLLVNHIMRITFLDWSIVVLKS